MSNRQIELSITRTLLANRSFRRLLMAQFCTVVAVYSLSLAGVTLVEEQTHSSAQTGLVIVSSILPAFLASLVAGAVVDRRGRTRVLLASHLTRGLTALAFWVGTQVFPLSLALTIVYASNMVMAILTQFALTSELALVPDFTDKRRLMSANALLQLSMLAAEGLGIILLGPLIARFLGAPAVGLVGACLCLLAGLLIAGLPSRMAQAIVRPESETAWTKLREDLQTGWQTIIRDRVLGLVVLQAALAATLLLVLVALLPGLASRHWGLAVEDVPFVILPGGVGFVLGSLLVGRWQDLLSRQAWIGLGLTGVGLATVLVGALSGDHQQIWLILLAILGLGLMLSLVVVPARTVLQERPPADLRGRVISTQLALGNAGAVVPLLLGGSLADLIGIRPVMVILGIVAVGAGVLGLARLRNKRT